MVPALPRQEKTRGPTVSRRSCPRHWRSLCDTIVIAEGADDSDRAGGRARVRAEPRRARVGLGARVVGVAPLEPGPLQRARGRGHPVVCVPRRSLERRDAALQRLDGDGVAAARGGRDESPSCVGVGLIGPVSSRDSRPYFLLCIDSNSIEYVPEVRYYQCTYSHACTRDDFLDCC